jgi:hypothetical protein
MKRIILFLMLLSVSLAFGQNIWTEGQAVSNTNGNYFLASNSDSVFWDEDTLYICGAETAYVWINTGTTKGMLTYKAHVTGKDTMSHASDSARCVFELALVKGLSFNALDASVTETFYGMDSSDVAQSGTGAIYFYPFQNANLDQKHTNFYVLRIKGRYSTNLSAIRLREERVRAY